MDINTKITGLAKLAEAMRKAAQVSLDGSRQYPQKVSAGKVNYSQNETCVEISVIGLDGTEQRVHFYAGEREVTSRTWQAPGSGKPNSQQEERFGCRMSLETLWALLLAICAELEAEGHEIPASGEESVPEILAEELPELLRQIAPK